MEITMVPVHRKASRKVEAKDMQKVLQIAEDMRAWMMQRHSCSGLAHCQVDETDPMAFFITENELIINPHIIWHSPGMIESKEGCMTYPDREWINHSRHKSIIIGYEIFKNKKFIKKDKQVMGFDAIVYQHEIDHINAKYCYDNESK